MSSPYLIHDRIYGSQELSPPVFSALISSPSVQRMAGIGQFGIPDEFYHRESFSRLEHCLGVMLLLRKLGATEEEQIAGLLHDISHTAFSHVVDWVVGSGRTEDYQDKHHQNLILSSEIAPLLKTHGHDPARISDYHHFPLLERDSPDLCADRVDYALREFAPEITQRCLPHLTTHKDTIVFNNLSAALLFARSFLSLHTHHWGGYEATSRYTLFSLAIKHGITYQVIEFDDLWKDDLYVTEKLKAAPQPDIQYILSILRHKSLANLPRETKITHKKFRFVDPLVIQQNVCQRLSAWNSTFGDELERARHENSCGVYAAALPTYGE